MHLAFPRNHGVLPAGAAAFKAEVPSQATPKGQTKPAARPLPPSALLPSEWPPLPNCGVAEGDPTDDAEGASRKTGQAQLYAGSFYSHFSLK